MKWITFYIAFFLLTANSYGEGHFVSTYDSNAPDYMSLNVIEATINGLALEAGDEVAVFDGTLCCGKVIISVPIVYPSTSEVIKVSVNFLSSLPTEHIPGYTPGHPITYKFWDSSNLLEISGIATLYVDNSGNTVSTPTFTNGESAFVKLSATVTSNQSPLANAGADQTIIEGVSVTLDGSASSDPDNNTLTYFWTAPSGIILSSTIIAKPTFTAPEVSVNTNYTFSLIVNDGTVDSASDPVVINVQDCTPTAPTIGTITQPTCALATGSVILNGLPATGTWTLTKSPDGTTTTGTGTSSTISALAAGTYTYTVTNASGCISSASASVVINAQPTTPTAPTVGTITQPTCALATGSVVLNGLPATGTWTLTKSPDGTTTTGTGTSSTISALTAGTYTYTVTNASGCVSAASASVVINAQPTTPTAPTLGTITQPNCALATGSVVLNGLPATGTWTLTKSPDGTTTTGTGTSSTISALTAGTYTYTVTNASGCVSAASASVVINAQPTTPTAPTLGTITQPNCALATGSVVLNGLPATGTWTLTKSPDGTTTTGTGTSSTISALAAGTYTYTVTNASGCVSSASASVVINAQPITPTAPNLGTITQPTCALATGSVVLYGLPATGTWTLTRTPGGTTTTGTGTSSTISALAAGTYTYTVTNASGCVSAASASVVINAQPTTPMAPTLGTITQPTCALATGSMILNGLPATGTWTLTKSPDGTTTTGTGTSSTISALAAGTYTYTVTNASGCVSAASASVVISAQPTTPTAPTVGTITQPTCALATGSVILNGLPATGTWTLTKSPDGTTTTGTGTSSTISALAAGTYTYTVTNASGCVSAASASVVISAQPTTPTAPTVGTITQPTCALATGSVVLNGLPATGTWTLTKSPDGTTTAGTGTSSTISALAAGTYTYTVTNASGCVSAASASVVISAQPTTPTAPTVGTITQPTCALATGSVVLNGLPATGTWTLTKSPDGTTTTGTGTSSTISALAAGTYTYTVTNASGCVSSASTSVVINAQPITPTAPTLGTITQPTCALATGSVILNGLPATGIWTLTKTPGGTTTTGSGISSTISALAAGTYTYTVTNASGCVSAGSANVVINAQSTTPMAPTLGTIAQPTTLASTGSVILNGLPATGTWTLTRSPGGTITSGTGISTIISALAAGTYTYTVTNASGCVSAASASVFINALPASHAGVDQTINEGVVVTLDGSASSDPENNTLTYTWTAPTGITLSSTTAAKPTFTAPEVMTDQNYAFFLIVNDGTVNSTADQVIVTVRQVNKAPVANAGTDQTVNEGAVVNLDGSASSDPDNNSLTYTWTAPTGITLSSSNVAKPTFTAPEVMTDQNYTLSLIINDGTVNSTADQVIITVKQVNKAPVANAGADQTVNEGVLVTLYGSASSDQDNNTLTYTWNAPTGITLSSTTAAKPTFTAPEVMTDQNYTFSLFVNDGTVNSTSDQVIIIVKQVNKAPIANAGADQTVNEGAVVNLDGSASSDSDNNTLTYIWTAPAGLTLSSTTAAKPTFTAPEVMTDQNYTLSLIVNDGIVNSASDQIIITVRQVNKAPVANAGPDQSVEKNTLYTLDGSSSSDPDGDELTYLWTAPAGITLSSNSVAKPTFTTPATISPSSYSFTLAVSDSKLSSPSDQVVITLKQSNQSPIAQAGIDQSVDEGVLVTLDGSASTDPDGDALIYSWIAPAGITLSSTTAAKPTFTAPEVLMNQNYTFSLTVNDGTVNSTVDQVIITVRQVNKVPLANAGADQIVFEKSLVSLNGSSSYDPENSAIAYTWSTPVGITLSSIRVANPTFTAPETLIDKTFTFSLIVNDGFLNSTTDQVVIKVKHINLAPIANAGNNQTVDEGAFVTLDGSASSDPENNTLTYYWSAPNGISLSSTSAAKPTFTAPEVMTDQNYTFSLTVYDGTINTVAEVNVTVRQVNKAPVANAGADQTVNEGVLVTLDGSASSDPDKNTLTYKWTAPSGITLSSTTAAKPTFTAPEVLTDQSYIFSLVVNDGAVNSGIDQLFITVRQINKPPVLTSNKSYTINEDVPQELLFEASDAENDPINFSIENLPSFLHLAKKTNNSAVLSGTFTNQYVGNYTFKLNLSDGVSNTQETITLSVTNIDDAPYVKDSIRNVSVNKGASDIIIDLRSVFADDDQGDLLSFSVSTNTNDKIVTAKIAGTDLTLSFSKEITGLSQIIIKASSNGKEAQSKFNVEVKIPTGIEQIDDNAEVLVFPNPTEGNVHIKFEKIPENGTWINIYNGSGKLIIKSLIKSMEEIVKLNGYVPGVYFIQITQKKPKIYKVILK